LPDCRLSFVTTPHTINQTYSLVQQKIQELMNEYNNDAGITRRNCIKLGEVLHYIADFFTFPHNDMYTGTIKDHCMYEKELKHELRRYVRSGEAMEQRSKLTIYETPEDLLHFIQKTHEEYRKNPSIVLKDCHYIVRVCMEVSASLVAILRNSFTEMRVLVAQPM